jgi:DNA modification methylase
MNVQQVSIDKVVPYARNPRRNDAAIDKVAASIKEFGFRQPIVTDSEMVIIVGHTRLLAARKLGIARVPVHVAEGLTPAQVRAYRLADNRVHEEADWNKDLLAIELQDLQGAGFDLSLTGFDDDELASLLADVNEGLTDPDDAPPVGEVAVSKVGDLWHLGKHRLLVGDCTGSVNVDQVMGDLKADLIVTDPPYNVSYTGKTKDALKIENDSKSASEFYSFLLAAYKAALAITKPGAGIYVFHADLEGVNFRRAFVDAGWKLSQCCVWVKQTIVMGRSDYHWQHEPVLYGWKPTAGHRWYSDRKQSTVWRFDRPTRSLEHPTMKPIELVEYPLKNSSRGGDVIFDGFGGSGSTLIACEKNGRICRTMELDPIYADVIIRRWQNFTGKEAKLENGTTFAKVEGK